MSKTPTISELFSEAAAFMRAEFEFIRKSNPHPGDKGEEIENVLITFLNEHLPKRFRATSGLVIDDENRLSKQTDVIIYDAFSSPVYRSSSKTQIVPVDSVASVIEVKARLNKKDLQDSFEKIASCKALKKRPFEGIDQKSTGSTLETVATLGIIFGFDSDTSINSLAGSMNELMAKYDSDLWPEIMVILDKGMVGFAIQYPGEEGFPGSIALPHGNNFVIPPMFIHLVVHNDGEYTFNRFFTRLLSHLTFYPRRPSTPSFDTALAGTAKQALTISGYQFNLSRKLVPASEEAYGNKVEVSLQIMLSTKSKKGKSHDVGVMQHLKWQDGSVIRFFGSIRLVDLLKKLNPKEKVSVVMNEERGYQISCVLAVDENDFRKWPDIINRNTKFKAKLVETENA